MRLINTKTYELKDFNGSPDYAILSHRWRDSEISFRAFSTVDLNNASLQNPSLNKIRGACAKARERQTPLEWLWIDTCCIDKSNAVEETRSINAMFNWYRDAVVCYTYLDDVAFSSPGPSIFQRQQSDQASVWFQRGWTLQELLAPRHLEFYDVNWKFMGSREELKSNIQQLTGINERYLTGDMKLREASVATRMSWMAGRATTEVEDIAYSMIGLFSINMTPQYGEGEKAFMRLQRTLIEESTDESIFAWTVPSQGLACYRRKNDPPPKWNPESIGWGLLAPSPDCFKGSEDVVVIEDKVVPRLGGGYQWTQQGIQFQMTLKAGSETRNIFGVQRKEINLPLNCWTLDGSGKPLTIVIELVKSGDLYKRVRCDVLEQKKGAKASNNRSFGVDQMLTMPLTIGQPALPKGLK